ncbi:restriction endonuclease subunit S [Bacteroides fragilis]|uniref:restriction endonuclease subunit S n=1 Tax=Bacteroides fragilis TaxID=817 RepID=UPI002A07127C|nr:restriction endonuclease subunit S [Bacteroides fragilis]MCE9032830.1 restriction endonuclease subunit S [Bacteroides fragilis]
MSDVPHLRFPEFSGEWYSYPLTDFMSFKNGMNPDAKRFGRGIKFISVMDILNNQFICYDNIRASVEVIEGDIETYGVNYGDILFQRSSETLEDVGQANVYLDRKPAVFGGFVIRGKSKGNYHPVFFRYLLASPTARKRIIVKGAGAQHFNIGQDGLSRVCLNIPSIQEQEKIAKLFECVDTRIATQNKIIEDLKKLKSAIIEIEYSPKDSYHSHIGGAIVQISKRNKDNHLCNVLSVSNRQGFIKQSEQFEDRNVASDDTSNYKIVEKNDFAYNPARINVGSIARLTKFETGIVSPMYICFRTKDCLLPEYLELFFESRNFFYHIQKRLEGSVRLCLSYEELCNIPIVIPSIEKQKQVDLHLSKLAQKIDLEMKILQFVQQQKTYLLHQMFI